MTKSLCDEIIKAKRSWEAHVFFALELLYKVSFFLVGKWAITAEFWKKNFLDGEAYFGKVLEESSFLKLRIKTKKIETVSAQSQQQIENHLIFIMSQTKNAENETVLKSQKKC